MNSMECIEMNRHKQPCEGGHESAMLTIHLFIVMDSL